MDRFLPFEWIAALRFLREGRMQTALIIIGVAIGVGVIVFMSALLTGLQANIIRRTLSAQAHIVILPPEEAPRVQRALHPATALTVVQPQAQRLQSIDQWQSVRSMLQAMPEVTAVSPIASGPAFAQRGEASRAVTLIGIEPEHYVRVIALADKIVAGRLRLTSNDVVIGTELASDLGAEIGDKVRISTASGGQSVLSVTGIYDLGAKTVNLRNVYVALRSAQSLLDLAGGVSSIDLTVAHLFDAEDIAQRISGRTGLTADSWIHTNAQFVVALRAQTLSNSLIRFFVGLSVAFGIASVLVVSVVQKTREIGILRAMGASRGQMLRVFLIQGGLVGCGGSLVGAALGLGFATLFRTFARNADGTPLFPIQLDYSLYLWAALLASLTGVIAAVMPARRAAKLDPVVAIRG
ncbi:lipoprotein-releasing system permease protein [Plasticicumulans lactativorans]|uniref:Lipoprotein-releasing system permease protein n=1 Tax=Plasticicumulans lactativorans TaxID=1133106 RepID=A0A4R2L9A9_9GAMM|nr:ABC transporter permease [Plasticicumulans lactativorans]TCO81933.1 lipoprotein-releasing system permease protein [Plasticicumulans lactativorans]